MPAGGRGGGRAWGGDLIVFVGPGVGHLTDLVLPGEGVFESFFARRGDTKKTETEHMFPTSTLHACAIRSGKMEIMEANENKRKLGGFHCFASKFCLF